MQRGKNYYPNCLYYVTVITRVLYKMETFIYSYTSTLTQFSELGSPLLVSESSPDFSELQK